MLLSVIDPDDLRPHASRSSSTRRRSSRRTGCARSRSATRTTRTRSPASPGAWIDYEPAESTTTHVRRQLELARPDLDAGQLPRDPPVRPLPALLRRRLHARVPDRLGAAAHVRRDRPGPRRPARRDLAPGRRTAAARSTAAPSGSRRTRPGRTTSSSTSTSTATTAPASARRTRPAGRRSSPT